jgi:hypothetical protein
MDSEEKEEKLPAEINGVVLSKEHQAVLEQITGGNWKKYGRVAMAAMGSLPWVGSVVSATATLWAENEQGKTNHLLYLWVQEHEDKLRALIGTLQSIFARLESFGDEIQARINSPEYLNLVGGTFRIWDEAETGEKRDMLRKLITNAGGVKIVQDDIVRLFLDFLEKFHELHFAVIREIYAKPRITRSEIWENLDGEDSEEFPREDSSKADLFKLLIHELSTGYIVRQARATDAYGNWQRQPPRRRTRGGATTSAFDREKEYVLTELGAEFVHYVMDDLAPQLGSGDQA